MLRHLKFVLTLSAALLALSCDESELTEKPSVYGAVTGKVINASTGAALAGATLTVVGSTVTTTSDVSGNYSLPGLLAGTRTIRAGKTGYSSDEITVEIIDGTVPDKNFSLLPTAYTVGKYSIVLTWGQEPLDLDSHMYVPNGVAGFQISYMDVGDNDGTLDTDPFAALDVDQVNSFGPETISVKKVGNSPHYSGKYRYFVHNFSVTPGFDVSQAIVKVYDNGTLVKEYHVPTNGPTGDYWHVFDLQGGVFTDVNFTTATMPVEP